MAKLVIYEESENADAILEDFELTIPQMLIGSGPDNELVLETAKIDPTHASLELRDNHWILQDLGGPGGTAVNGQEVEGPVRLHHGDLIELGPVRIRFEEKTTNEQLEATKSEDKLSANDENPVRGRVWFAGVAGATLVAILIILVLLVIADYVGVLEILDLLPPWFGKGGP